MHVESFFLRMKHLRLQRSNLADSFSRATEKVIAQAPQPIIIIIIIRGNSGEDGKENSRHNELRLIQRCSKAIQVEVLIDSNNYSPKVELILLKYINWEYSTIFIEPLANDYISIIYYRSKSKFYLNLVFFFCF